jgi:hypothetical protein
MKLHGTIILAIALLLNISISSSWVVGRISDLMNNTCAVFEYRCAKQAEWPPSSYDRLIQEVAIRNHISPEYLHRSCRYDITNDGINEYLVPLMIDDEKKEMVWIVLAGERPYIIAEIKGQVILIHTNDLSYPSLSSFSQDTTNGCFLLRWFYDNGTYTSKYPSTLTELDCHEVRKLIKECACRS